MYEQEIPGDAAHERVLSIVVPCYNEEESIPLFYRETRKAANELRQRPRVQVEYVFVDDGSTDSTLDILKKAARAGQAGALCFLFKELRQGIRLIRGIARGQWRFHGHA